MASRTFGWVQDAGKLFKIKPIIIEFIQYERMNNLDTHQLISKSLSIGRWANETYLRLCEALGFIEYDREYDDFVITDLGKKLAFSTEQQEIEILEEAILTYPPACRILQLLKDSSEPLSKFEIAQNLGFVGESGFTTFGLNNFIRIYHTSTNKSKIKSDKESTLDKYARMIANYLIELGMVEKTKKKLVYSIYEAETPHTYQITEKGIQAYTKTLGRSTSKKIQKNVSFEMLSSRKQFGNEILRERRALILDIMNQKKGKLLTYDRINEYLQKNSSNISIEDFKQDIKKLQNLGLLIENIGDTVVLKENINLNIPIFATQDEKIKKEIQKTITYVVDKTQNLDENLIEKIIEQSFSGQKLCKEFEDSIFKLYNETIGFEGIKLGGIGNREPDSLFWYKVRNDEDNYGLIVDAKAYSKGFKINTSSSRQMNDYIYKFYNKLKEEHGLNRSHYHWVTSKYIGNGDIEYFAENVRNMYSFESKGSIISISNALLIADKIQSNRDFKKLESLMSIEREILETDIEVF
ncbi:restriction endonuclease FokI catalytic domain-containing protein [Aliarcobacter skirrowii]|uniref:restriction endonuclease FokI catalytic domain-containing protein n=1 Tax=Aliarcobacter skirrowii TaxID=28200 RepID=UPI0029A2C98D|nr:restriction endonuclease FokI catalytic domain-containing protein [Aliarcobacter skirrowii]MDX4028688.1 restriction endonuclease FokI catalytic domain-containing protein [Aliarcobacter skirrowii]